MPRVNDLLSSNINKAIQNQITWSIFYNVKEEGAIGNGAIDDYPAINHLINNKIQGNALVIFPKGEYLIRSNMTVPPNVFLYFVGEGLLKPDTGVTITINGGIIAGPYPIFVGDGNTDGSNPKVEKIFPQWWGAAGDGVRDDTTAIVKTRGMSPSGATIWFLSGDYLVTDPALVTAPTDVYYIGEGQASNFMHDGVKHPIPAYGVLSSVSPNRAVVSDSSGALTTSNISTSELNNLQGLTSNVQTHISNADIHVTAAKKIEWDSKAPGSTAAELINHINDTIAHLTATEHDKLTGIQAGAEVNQNAFSVIAVDGQGNVNAASKTAMLKFKNGTGITITTNPLTGEVTITATGQATPGPHASSHLPGGTDTIPDATQTVGGLMSNVDKAKLDGATSDATANRIVTRDTNGQFKVGAPTEPEHTARKQDIPAFATKAQAEEGTDNSTIMTPQRTNQAIQALVPQPDVIWRINTSNNLPEWSNDNGGSWFPVGDSVENMKSNLFTYAPTNDVSIPGNGAITLLEYSGEGVLGDFFATLIAGTNTTVLSVVVNLDGTDYNMSTYHAASVVAKTPMLLGRTAPNITATTVDSIVYQNSALLRFKQNFAIKIKNNYTSAVNYSSNNSMRGVYYT